MPFHSLHHLKIDVEDLDRAVHFYQILLGFKEIVRYDRTDGVTIVQLSPTGAPPGIELWHEIPWKGIRNDRLHFAFSVTDLERLVLELSAKGVETCVEPFQIGHEKIAFLRDSDGYLIELNEDCSPDPIGLIPVCSTR